MKQERKRVIARLCQGRRNQSIIVKPKEKSDACSSDQTKRDIKNGIDVAKLGIGITAMKFNGILSESIDVNLGFLKGQFWDHFYFCYI